ncbi:MAG: nuclear transport factor 2 family protein [Actinobacteria bacterium]|nr:MAG: nuclear transport factor 2 family protein [Actinomycetota bacterium]
MSQENVESMRRAIERFNRGGEDDALLADFYDSDAVFHSRADEPDTGVYRGRDAIRESMHMWHDTFDEFRFQVDEYIDAGEVLVMPGLISVRGRGSTAEVREPYMWLVNMRDGKVLEVHEYRTKEAREAAGLSG